MYNNETVQRFRQEINRAVYKKGAPRGYHQLHCKICGDGQTGGPLVENHPSMEAYKWNFRCDHDHATVTCPTDCIGFAYRENNAK